MAAAFGGYVILVRLLPYLLDRMGFAVTLDAGLCPWNYSPMMALCLFGGARFARPWTVWVVGLGSYLVSDLLLAMLKGPAFAFHPVSVAVYAAFAGGILLGSLLRRRGGSLAILGTGLGAEIAFFGLTNFVVWLLFHGQPPTYYSFDLKGLMSCYAMGLPFFKYSLLSTAFYGVLLFGGWAYLTRSSEAREDSGSTVTG